MRALRNAICGLICGLAGFVTRQNAALRRQLALIGKELADTGTKHSHRAKPR